MASEKVTPLNPTILDQWPAMEVRFDSRLPAERRDFWTQKWLLSGGKLFDGRLIALKNDPVWRAMTGAKKLKGEAKRWLVYRAWNIPRKEAQALGLIQLMEELDPLAFEDESHTSLTRKMNFAERYPGYKSKA